MSLENTSGGKLSQKLTGRAADRSTAAVCRQKACHMRVLAICARQGGCKASRSTERVVVDSKERDQTARRVASRVYALLAEIDASASHPDMGLTPQRFLAGRYPLGHNAQAV